MNASKPTAIATRREQEIIRLLSEGKTAKEIASELYISAYTVTTHQRNLMSKLGARNTLHMVVKAMRLGVVA